MKNKKAFALWLTKLIKALLLLLALNTLLLVGVEFTPMNKLGPWLKANVVFSLEISPAPNPSSASKNSSPSKATRGGGGRGPSTASTTRTIPPRSESSPVTTREEAATDIADLPEPERPAEPTLLSPEPETANVTTPTPTLAPSSNAPQSPSAEATYPILDVETTPETPPMPDLTEASPEENSITAPPAPAPQEQNRGGILSKILVVSEFALSASLIIATIILYLVV